VPSTMTYHAEHGACDHTPCYPTRRSSDLTCDGSAPGSTRRNASGLAAASRTRCGSPKRRFSASSQNSCRISVSGSAAVRTASLRSEEHTSELQSRENLVCRLLLEKDRNLH